MSLTPSSRRRGPRQKSSAERRLARAFEDFLRECLAEAVSRGLKDPQFYFESESGLVVLDGMAHDGPDASPQRDRVRFVLPWPSWLRGRVDVGAW